MQAEDEIITSYHWLQYTLGAEECYNHNVQRLEVNGWMDRKTDQLKEG